METKKCSKCKIVKPVDEFYKRSKSKDGHGGYCKNCLKEYNNIRNTREQVKAQRRQYRLEHRDENKAYCQSHQRELKEYHHQYYLDHKEYYKEYSLIHRDRYRRQCTVHREEINARKREQEAMYRKNPQFRLNSNMSSAMCRSLHGNKANRHWEDLVGYMLLDLKNHLEKQFLPGMTWDNYGSVWHVDHIIPRSVFMYSSSENPEFKKCWALENLRPMWATVNSHKGDKLDSSLVITTLRKIGNKWL
jgi:hypothetical protein